MTIDESPQTSSLLLRYRAGAADALGMVFDHHRLRLRRMVQLRLDARLAARVEGKSSLARLGVGVHVTAPTIHAGFGYNPNVPDNPGLPIQLEIFNVGNQTIVLDVGMPICQLILEEVREVPTKGYQGRFNAQQTFSV